MKRRDPEVFFYLSGIFIVWSCVFYIFSRMFCAVTTFLTKCQKSTWISQLPKFIRTVIWTIYNNSDIQPWEMCTVYINSSKQDVFLWLWVSRTGSWHFEIVRRFSCIIEMTCHHLDYKVSGQRLLKMGFLKPIKELLKRWKLNKTRSYFSKMETGWKFI